MRICLYTDTALPKVGGQELVVDALARQFQRFGHDVVVLAPHPRGSLQLNDASLPYPIVRHPRFFSSRYLVGWYRRWLLNLHRARPFDVVHCHGIYPPGYLATLCRPVLGAPIVITSHGGDVEEGTSRLAKSVVQARHMQALTNADALVAISSFIHERFRRACPQARQVADIPNGVDVDAYATPTTRPQGLDSAIQPRRYALFLGRLKHRKGVDILLDALAARPAAGGVELVIAGDGEDRAALEQQTARLGLSKRVRFLGATANPAKTYLLQNALCTVVPSRGWEGFPLVVLESYAAGSPVIAARRPGLDERVQHERTGFLVSAESPPELAAALGRAFADPAAMRRLGERAKEAAKEFSWEAVGRKHVALYEQLLDSRSLRRAV
jgi:glycosyltransferase involved in cell wall biosynthesis